MTDQAKIERIEQINAAARSANTQRELYEQTRSSIPWLCAELLEAIYEKRSLK
jgi:hypothetical protein